MPNLSASGPSGMIFEHFQYFFHLEDSTSGLSHLFQFCFHIAQGHISRRIARILGAVAHLLAMNKPLGRIRPITVRETLY